MTVLCLHGAYGSAYKFQIQLQPFVQAVEKTGTMEFKWISGSYEANPPAGFKDYFGPPPLYRFIDCDGISAMDDLLTKIRDIPQGLTAEDSLRKLVGDSPLFTPKALKASLDELIGKIDEDPEVDGILGYSEGAAVSASLILEEQRRFEEEGRPRRIKYAIFFAGWPPARLVNGKVQMLFADECEDMIDIPTCHIIGCNDPYVNGAMALYGMCDEDTAVMFDHGKGHTVPRDARTVAELTRSITTTWDRRGDCALQDGMTGV
ncbi:Serine hydrolase (FSH1) [Geosmithia morbida]|uniref:Serine hydrolase (FSH1) n=1 Tax=Geosmithia morbida TaxID=1094350 RepID=A0A9P4YZC7_9HYPO|nr:Serine hydrolase (FSH1) [Geosmithia morbida]KAF4124438.1 Serine hydrolase (FSH1) [Geosmithia morbida]